MSARPGLLLFGGAFNPPHRTHRAILTAALAQVPADRALVLPSGRHPLKKDGDMAPDAARLELCELAFRGMAGVTVDDREIRRRGVAYTVDTAREIAAAMPDRRLFLLVGADNLRILDVWHAHHELLRLVTVVTYPRLGYAVDAAMLEDQDLTAEEVATLLDWVLEFEADDVSATAIRAAMRRGDTHHPALEPAVARRIHELGLYRT